MDEPMKVCSRTDCPHGGTPQPLSHFYTDRKHSDGRKSECKTCHIRDIQTAARGKLRDTDEGVQRNTEYVRAWRERNAEAYRVYDRDRLRRWRAKRRMERTQQG
jgi:hypothetical protein